VCTAFGTTIRPLLFEPSESQEKKAPLPYPGCVLCVVNWLVVRSWVEVCVCCRLVSVGLAWSLNVLGGLN
jgi:hypothetical protein